MKRSALFILLLLIALCLPFAVHAAEDERQVTVTGVGANEEEAKRQAYRNAVQSVVGALVVAETLVENDALVNDKILSHSDGYVTKVEQMGQTVPLDGGMVEVTMQVTVKSQQLREKLQAENISVIEVDGQSLFARAATQSEQTRDAAAIVADFLKNANLPASLINSTADIGKAEVTESGGTATVKVPISVSVNMDAYSKFVGDFKKTLTDLGFNGETLSLGLISRNTGPAGGRPIVAADNSARALRDLGKRLWPDNTSSSIIAICEMFSLESGQSRFTFFTVPRNVFESIMEAVPPVLVDIRTELQDGNQSRITEQNVRLTMQPFHKSYDRQKADILSWSTSRGSSIDRLALLVSPGLRRDASWINFEAFPIACMDHSPTVTLEATFVLSNDELKAAKAIRTNAVNSPAPAK